MRTDQLQNSEGARASGPARSMMPNLAAQASGADAASCRALVVVPTLNEEACIETVLQALIDEAGQFRRMTIVVADGGSVDNTIPLVETLARTHPAIKLVHNPARIQSAGINLAVRRFGGDSDVLIRCDAHALYPPGYCARLLATMTETRADAVVVPLDSIGSDTVQRAIAYASNSAIGTGGSAHRAGRRSGFVDHGHHAAVRLEAFRASGGYDEGFSHNEDAELDCRLRALGFRLYLDCATRVGYRPRSSLTGLFRQYYRYGAGRSRTVRRHPSSLRLRQIAVPGHLFGSVVAIAISPWASALLVWPAFYLLVLAGNSVVEAARHRSACALLTGPVAFVMHTAWALGFFTGLLVEREQRWRVETAVPL